MATAPDESENEDPATQPAQPQERHTSATGGPNDGTAHKKRKRPTSHAAVSKGEVITHGDGDPQTKKARAKAPKTAKEKKEEERQRKQRRRMGLRRVSEEFYPAAKALYMEAFNCSE